jgi:hypothetical protein
LHIRATPRAFTICNTRSTSLHPAAAEVCWVSKGSDKGSVQSSFIPSARHDMRTRHLQPVSDPKGLVAEDAVSSFSTPANLTKSTMQPCAANRKKIDHCRKMNIVTA